MAHGPDHAAHHHHVAPRDVERAALRRALGLIAAYMLAEVVVGILAGSLALLSDAAHMLTDAVALTVSLAAVRLAARPAAGAMTYGLGRVEILSAQANGVTLLVLAVAIVIDSITRLIAPPAVSGGPVLAVALCGILVNLAAAIILARGSSERRSLNLEGSLRHVVTDVYGSAATAGAAIIILLTGFRRADPIASLIIAGLLLRAAYGLLRASGRVFLEAAPEDVDVGEIGRALATQPGVVEVHDLHVWELTTGFVALSAHVAVGAGRDCHALRRELAQMLHRSFGIDHTTLQVDHEAAAQPPLQIEMTLPASSTTRPA
jgi:cobalt-zinc-cadmium efflux system protein